MVKVKIKVKFSLEQAMKKKRRSRGIALLFLYTRCYMGVGGQRQAQIPLPPGRTRYPLYRRLGGPQSRSEQVQKIMHPPGFNPRSVQPVASRCTDYAILAPAESIMELLTQWHSVASQKTRTFRNTPVRTTNLVADVQLSSQIQLFIDKATMAL